MMGEIIENMNKAEQELILAGTFATEGERQAVETCASSVQLSEATGRANDLGAQALQLLTESYAKLGLFVEAQHDGSEAGSAMRTAAERTANEFFAVGSCATSAGELITLATGEDEPAAARLQSAADGTAQRFRDLQNRAAGEAADFSRGERGAKKMHTEIGMMLGLLKHLVEETPSLSYAGQPLGRTAAQQAAAAKAKADGVQPAIQDLQAKVTEKLSEWK